MHEVLVNRLGGLSLPRKSVVRLTDRPNMTLDVYRGRKTTIQHDLCVDERLNLSSLTHLEGCTTVKSSVHHFQYLDCPFNQMSKRYFLSLA